jgi:hypothetical protein
VPSASASVSSATSSRRGSPNDNWTTGSSTSNGAWLRWRDVMVGLVRGLRTARTAFLARFAAARQAHHLRQAEAAMTLLESLPCGQKRKAAAAYRKYKHHSAKAKEARETTVRLSGSGARSGGPF